ncbi:hypothetical protein ACSYAD_33155, partial [Acaryochloris marina NIES-2412]|uniref:hypothetical protein n=1 Tax=Acaryochloris marina TaxID=155978 RepID=UPI004059D3A9
FGCKKTKAVVNDSLIRRLIECFQGLIYRLRTHTGEQSYSQHQSISVAQGTRATDSQQEQLILKLLIMIISNNA